MNSSTILATETSANSGYAGDSNDVVFASLLDLVYGTRLLLGMWVP